MKDYVLDAAVSLLRNYADLPFDADTSAETARRVSERTLAALDTSPLLSEGALVIVESGEDEKEVPPLSGLSLVREERDGHTTRLRIFEKREDEG